MLVGFFALFLSLYTTTLPLKCRNTLSAPPLGLLKKSKYINRKGRKDSTQRTQRTDL
jgi:hypothetical protein